MRGYDEYEVVADGGILASAQYEFDLVKYNQSSRIDESEPGSVQADRFRLKKLAPLAFIDYGRSRIEDPIIGERKHRTLFSVGIGTIFELGDNLSGGIYYGYPLKATDETRKGKGRLNVNIMLRW